MKYAYHRLRKQMEKYLQTFNASIPLSDHLPCMVQEIQWTEMTQIWAWTIKMFGLSVTTVKDKASSIQNPSPIPEQSFSKTLVLC